MDDRTYSDTQSEQNALSPQDQITIWELADCANETEQHYEVVPVRYEDLVFEERVRFNCFYCGKYNNSWKCPPRIPEVDYKKMFSEYRHLAFVYGRYTFDNDSYASVRAESTNLLHKTLLKLEKVLWDNNNSLAISFIGGSCKLCKNGCGKDKCNNPYLARTPLEATGINIVRTAEKYGIAIEFPPKESIMRLGMILW